MSSRSNVSIAFGNFILSCLFIQTLLLLFFYRISNFLDIDFFAFILAQAHNKKREQEVDIEIHEEHKELTNYHCFLQWLKKWNVDAKLQTKSYWGNVKLGNTALQTYWYCFTSWLYHCHILRLFNELYFTISKTRFVFICYIPTYKKGRRGNSMRCNLNLCLHN